MEFGLSEEQRMLEASVRRWTDTEAPQERIAALADAGTTCDAALWQGLAELGTTGILVPEAHGGAGLTLFDACLVQEALGRAAVPAPYLGTAILAPIALRRAEPAVAEQWLPAIARGERRIGIGLSEATGAREDAGVRVDGGRAHGRALFVVDGVDGDALVLVDRADDSIEVRALTTVDHTRGVVELELDGAAVTPVASGADAVEELVAAGRTAIAADILGAAEVMIDRAVAYSLERKQFDRVIGSFQAVKHMCAEMAADLEPCRSLVWYAAHAHEAFPDEHALMACHAKAHLSEVGQTVARKATEVHGGMGFTDELGLHYWFKRIGLDRQLLGGPERVRAQAASLQGWDS